MAETRGDMAIKGQLNVDGDAKFNKGLDSPYLELVDSKNRGEAGGTFRGKTDTGYAWRTRDLTETKYNDFATSINLSASKGDGADFTLDEGVYYTEISCPGFYVFDHMARLADVTDNPGGQGSTVVQGTTEFASFEEGTGSQTRTQVSGRFQLRGERTLEIQHQCTRSQQNNGFGTDGGFYESKNIFTVVKMWMVRDDT